MNKFIDSKIRNKDQGSDLLRPQGRLASPHQMPDIFPVEALPRDERPRRVGVDGLPALEWGAPVVVCALPGVQPSAEPTVLGVNSMLLKMSELPELLTGISWWSSFKVSKIYIENSKYIVPGTTRPNWRRSRDSPCVGGR